MQKSQLMAIMIIIALAVSIHQFIYWNTWFETEDIHHETFIILFFVMAVVIYFIPLDEEATGSCSCFG